MNLFNFDKAIMELMKHYKIQDFDKRILELEKEISQNCQDMIDKVAEVDRTKSTSFSPNTQKYAKTGGLSVFGSSNIGSNFSETLQVAKAVIKKKTILEISNESLKEAKKRIDILMERNQALEEAIKTMRFGFMKELQSYKEQLYRLEKYPENFEPVKAQYFSGLEVLEEDMRDMLNK